MFGHKTKDKRKRRLSWKWLTVLAGLASLFIAIWRAMVKKTDPEKREAPSIASKPVAEEREDTEEMESGAAPASGAASSEAVETELPPGGPPQ